MIKAYRGVLASLDVEGLKPSEEAQKWCLMYLNGTLTGDLVRERIYRKYGVMSKCVK